MDKKKLEKIQEKINNGITKKPVFQKLLEIKRLTIDTNEILRDKKALDKSHYGQVKELLGELKEVMESVDKKEFPEIPEFPKELTISNFPKPQEINIEKVEFPENLKKLKNVDMDKVVKAITSLHALTIEAIVKQAEREVKVSNSGLDEAIPVRMVFKNKNGKAFFDPDYGAGQSGNPAFHTGYLDTRGKEAKVTLTSGEQVPVSDPLLEIARDNVDGQSSNNKFGRNIEVDSGVTADVWDGGHTVASGGTSLIWLAPTAARIHTIASTSASDTTGGTGANSVIITYLPDWDTAETTEIVTGNLNAGIPMINAGVMINRMEVIIQGTSTIINAGDITATAAIDATVTARIRVGQGQTQMAIYGVPSIQKLKVGRFYSNTNKAGGATGLIDATLLANTAPDVNPIVFITKHTFGLQTVGTSAFTIPYYAPKKIDGPAIVKVQVSSNTNDMDVSAGFDFVVVNN